MEGSSYAHDFEETKGVDFQGTFAPTMKWPTIKAMIFVVVHQRCAIWHFDGETSFLNRRLHERSIHASTNRLCCDREGGSSLQAQKNILWFEASKSKMRFKN